MVTQLIAVDIGGTHARFARAQVDGDGAIILDEPVTLQTRDHASFQTAWEHYAEIRGEALPDAVAIAIAGPVAGKIIRFTNNPWIIRPAMICERLGVDRYTLVNDFAAVAHAVVNAPEKQLLHLAGPEKSLPQDGVVSVIGPGTGLGVAHLWRDGSGGYRVHATEGGHIDFAPLDQIEDSILARLRQHHDRVSVERVVSGPGIVDIYHALAALEHKAVEEIDDRTIWQLGISGQDSLASA
ncbi:MAG TPA: glucokinase, partial [Erythrobacter sp.]|nr:glucokinase [Erythrobacter sp.]